MPHKFATSGSTSKPKHFTMTDEQWVALVTSRTIAKAAMLAGVTSLFCDLPLAGAAGAVWQAWAEKNAMSFYIPVGGTIEAVIALFASANIDAIIGSPGGLLNYALAKPAHTFKSIISTGGTLSPARSKMIRAGLGDNLFVTYGASEVGSISVATATQVEATPGCVGKLCPGVQIAFDAVDAKTGVGTIKVKTSTMISGYADSELTKQFFKDGWFYPGDFGLMKDGLLVLNSRVKSNAERNYRHE
jgi:acyl-coenzyme A synthetase/AMP-(fatty) acid ligase